METREGLGFHTMNLRISKIDLRRVGRKMQRYYPYFKSKVLRRKELDHEEEKLAVGKNHELKLDMNILPVGKTRAHVDLGS